MLKLRYVQVSREATSCCHCYSHCVRWALLCGLDGLTQTSLRQMHGVWGMGYGWNNQ